MKLSGKMSMTKINCKGGGVKIQIIIKDCNQALKAKCLEIGYEKATLLGYINGMVIECRNAAELDAARNPLMAAMKAGTITV